ncbi:hypothetical protein [Streptococcus suis]|uniref:Uncharacterized protein n=1 Tax=Streptococcus suis TaxID=1307 RepID=A0A3R8NHR4_STRSU|nr:hypothetical protein [Streptococcus suis]MDN2948184.1 hypothetical protein [Streptococcus suis]RRN48776.1 hypothetical protein EI220_10715 [Streptococcus suis]HEL1563735.1 hypothetical protein [Streptococcus suis]HEL1909328.1 hypothetical protein [Streptococcus suis]HEL1917298.1 hypothetical protein [Streptococcus suis]
MTKMTEITENVIAWMQPSVLVEDRPQLTNEEMELYISLRKKRTLRQKMLIQNRRDIYADRKKFFSKNIEQ